MPSIHVHTRNPHNIAVGAGYTKLRTRTAVGPYRGTSRIRNTNPPRTTMIPWHKASVGSYGGLFFRTKHSCTIPLRLSSRRTEPL